MWTKFRWNVETFSQNHGKKLEEQEFIRKKIADCKNVVIEQKKF